MKLKSLYLSLCLGLSVLTSFADDIGAFPGYVASPSASGSANVIKTQFGDCVHNQYYKPDYAVEGCDGFVAEEESAPAPVVEPTVIKFSKSSQELFSFNSDVLSEKGKQSLLELFNSLPESSTINSMTVVGYTDSLGSDEYNQKLSEKRAKSVKDFISGLGVKSDIISSRGVGEKETVVSRGCLTKFGNDKKAKIVAIEAKIKKAVVKKDKEHLKSELSKYKKEQANLESCMAPDRRVEITTSITTKQ